MRQQAPWHAESRDLNHGTATVETDFWLNHGPQTQEKLEPKELQRPSGFLCPKKIIDGPLFQSPFQFQLIGANGQDSLQIPDQGHSSRMQALTSGTGVKGEGAFSKPSV